MNQLMGKPDETFEKVVILTEKKEKEQCDQCPQFKFRFVLFR